MITVEDKLEIFNKLVYKAEEEKCIREMEALEKRIETTLEEKKLELEKKAEAFIKRKNILANIQKNEMISQANENKKTNVLKTRESFLNDLMKSLEIKTKQFVQSNDYKPYLIKKISKVLNGLEEDKVILLLNEEDIGLIQESIPILQEQFKKSISIEASKKNVIGGFMILDGDKTYNLDYSFKTIIEENRYEIGKTLFNMLENVGELNG